VWTPGIASAGKYELTGVAYAEESGFTGVVITAKDGLPSVVYTGSVFTGESTKFCFHKNSPV
jgi:hypothetical protein